MATNLSEKGLLNDRNDPARQLAHARDDGFDVAVRRRTQYGAPTVADVHAAVRLVRSAHLLVEALQDLGRLHGSRL